MKTLETYEYQIPIWALPALVNDDFSGLENEDIDMVKAFNSKLGKTLGELGASHHTIDLPMDEEPYFSWTNAFCNLGCDVQMVNFHFIK